MHRCHYRNRAEAGRVLSETLTAGSTPLGDPSQIVVLGLARGGVPVAAEVARRLGAVLDVAVVRKLGVPGHEELALGAITRERIVLNDKLIRSLGVAQKDIDEVVARERRELIHRESAYRGGREPHPLVDRTVILVDDGIATGASMRAVALDARAQGARRVVVAVPTAPDSVSADFAEVADEFVCPHTPRPFTAVGMSYADFGQTSDDEVRALLT